MLLHFEELGLLSSALFDPRVALPCSVLLCSLLLQPWLGWLLLLYIAPQGREPFPQLLYHLLQVPKLFSSPFKWKRLASLCTVNKPWVVFVI